MKRFIVFILSAILIVGTVVPVYAESVTETETKSETNPNEPNIVETVLVDEQGIKITAEEIDYSGYSPELKLLLENNTDVEIEIYSNTITYNVNSVNSYMNDGSFHETIPAGESVTTTVNLHRDDLNAVGITKIAEIQFGIFVYDEDGNQLLKIDSIPIHTDIFDSYDLSQESFIRQMETPGFLSSVGASIVFSYEEDFLESDLAEISSICAIKNKDGDTVLFVDVLNTSDEILQVGLRDFYVNDLLVSSSMWDDGMITPGKHRVLSVIVDNLLDDTVWEALGITSIDKITFTFDIDDKEYNDLYYFADISLHTTGNEASFDTSGKEIYNVDGIRILYKAVVEDDSSYSDDFYLLLLVENKSGKELRFEDSSRTSTINGSEASTSLYNIINDGTWGILDIRYNDLYYDKAGIETLDDVNNIGLDIEVTDLETYDDIALIPVSISRSDDNFLEDSTEVSEEDE